MFFYLELELVLRNTISAKLQDIEELVKKKKKYSDFRPTRLSSDIFIDLTSTQPFFLLRLQPPYLKCAKEDSDSSRNSRWGSEI